MADDKPAPTEEQVKAANAAEEAKWQGDFKEEDLAVPYKREAEEEKEETKEKEAEPKVEEPAREEAIVEQVPTIEDPGDYKPADYSFEVTLKDGKTAKITTPEEAEKLAEDPDNFETPKQLMDFLNKQAKMRSSLDRDYEKWEAKHETFTKQLATETERREQIDSYVGEFNYLTGKGLLPPVAKEYADADWNDKEVATQPGVKEQIALLNYMSKENGIREKAGIKPITSIVDAFNAWQLDTGRRQSEEDNKAAGEARKAAGARVAGVSPTAQPGISAPKGIAVGNPNVLKRGASVWDD